MKTVWKRDCIRLCHDVHTVFVSKQTNEFSKPGVESKQALGDEAQSIENAGGLDPSKLYDKRNSPGKKFISQ